jgi:3-oxoacyl-[acyl-carrier protein] reductase
VSAQVVFVTGAARGLGAAIARGFVDSGARVALADVSANVTDTARRLDPGGERTLPLVTDVRDEATLRKAFLETVRHFGAVDVMVNNAALTIPRSVWEIEAAEWDSVMSTNVRGTFFGCRIAGKYMRERGQGGRIINLSSLAGQRGSTVNGLHYAASKGAILVITKAFAAELARDRVTVNAIAPAAISGPMLDSIDAAVRASLERGIPLGRFGEDREVAAAALYLASEPAGYVTGATLDLNGGMFMR